MRQDLNPNPTPCSSLVSFLWTCERKEAYFLQQGWTRLVEMTESEEEM